MTDILMEPVCCMIEAVSQTDDVTLYSSADCKSSHAHRDKFHSSRVFAFAFVGSIRRSSDTLFSVSLNNVQCSSVSVPHPIALYFNVSRCAPGVWELLQRV